MATRKPQIRKALMGADAVRKAIQSQRKTSPIFFMENSMRFDLLTEAISVGHKRVAKTHLDIVINASIQDDVELHRDFVNLIKTLKA